MTDDGQNSGGLGYEASEISSTNQEVEAVRALEDFLPFPLPGDDDGEA